MNIPAPEDYPHRDTIQQRLYLWAQRHPVNFPWRKKISRFHALVAEILLQRTKAEQVVPVFNSFKNRFPSVKSLSNASLKEIQLVISSLGLAWRAKFLKALAEELSFRNDRVPDQYSELLKLPGIGPYAAAAYLSLHRGIRTPIIDNNVVRFYSRLLGCTYDGETRRKKWVADYAEYMTPKQRFKEYNYAILDYTRLVCKPKPVCHVCSFTDICQYAEQVKQTHNSGVSIAETVVENMPNEGFNESHRKIGTQSILGFIKNGSSMFNENRPLIAPMTNEQKRKEEALSRELSKAESVTVCNILMQALSPESLQEVIENASGFAEAMTQKFRDPATPKVACKEGCNWCCFQSIGLFAPEAFRIVRFLFNEVTTTRLTDITKRLRKLDKATRNKSPKTRSKLRLPCAFLANGRCTIYPVRPLACAEFTSFNLQDCKRGYHNGFKPDSVTHEKVRMLVYHAVQQGLSDGLHMALPTADTAPLELTSSVISILDSSDPEVSWITGGKVFAHAHLAVN